MCVNQKILRRNHFVITVEPITVWAALGSFGLGMIVGALIVLDEMKRAAVVGVWRRGHGTKLKLSR